MSRRRNTIQKLYERDGGLCGICRTPVDASVRVPHPGAPSADHIIPRARGGAEALVNLQLSHFACNQAKGAKILPFQSHLGVRRTARPFAAPQVIAA